MPSGRKPKDTVLYGLCTAVSFSIGKVMTDDKVKAESCL
jgi:hypothetical protein